MELSRITSRVVRRKAPATTSKRPQGDRRLPPARHSAPSTPWPWVDSSDEIDPEQLETDVPPVPPPCNHLPGSCNGECWKGYPQSRFPNWTPAQVKRARIAGAISDYNKETPSVIYPVDVNDRGFFSVPEPGELTLQEGEHEGYWEDTIREKRPSNVRVRSLFIENMSGPLLQMLGAKYNIEPFFWSSSLHWIPSRYQEQVEPLVGDHITVTLTFVRSAENVPSPMSSISSGLDSIYGTDPVNSFIFENVIDTQKPLILQSETQNKQLVLDLLCVHLVRNVNGSTIISYHPLGETDSATTASYLQKRIRFAGRSVYWQDIFRSQDPTFVMITFLWHALYAWDEALETLYAHICSLESRVISTSDMALTQELHVIRAHHLHYSGLLEDFRKSVVFVRDTPNPAMDSYSEQEKQFSRGLLEKECYNLLSEIERLELGRRMQDKRLKNVMNLVFSSVNIQDSKRMQKMTEAAVRDSAAMKQIAYLTMIFLPASFVAAVFGMNVTALDPDSFATLPQYIAVAIPLTVVTIWLVVAFQSKHYFLRQHSIWKRLVWPFMLFQVGGSESESLKVLREANESENVSRDLKDSIPIDATLPVAEPRSPQPSRWGR